MYFTDAYAGYTVCSPSRATLFTGRHSGHLVGAPSEWPLLPELLRQAGYQTAVFGKSAPFDDSASPNAAEGLAWGLPTQFGFERFTGQADQALCHNMYPAAITNNTSPLPLPLNAKNKSRELCMAAPEQYSYTTDVFTDAAIGWLRTERVPSRPFFLFMSFTVPHAGGWGDAPEFPEDGNPVPEDQGYAQRAWPEVERDHAASVTHLDRRVGDLLAALDDQQLSTSTIVWFASDNGAHAEGGHDIRFFDSTGGLRGFKRSYYEGGVRSPSIVRWPGVTPPGSVSATPWAFWDVLPTILEVVGVAPPAGAHLDGRSIVPALRGEAQPSPKYLYWTWHGNADDDFDVSGGRVALSGASGYAARVGGWKVVVHACADQAALAPSDGDVMELYDLTVDPGERWDVAAQHPDQISSIKAVLAGEGLSCRCYQCPDSGAR